MVFKILNSNEFRKFHLHPSPLQSEIPGSEFNIIHWENFLPFLFYVTLRSIILGNNCNSLQFKVPLAKHSNKLQAILFGKQGVNELCEPYSNVLRQNIHKKV